MPLATGARLGVYAIQSAIGAGGMGEVYRARDTRLGRDVAIKVLPSEVAYDVDRLARFEREAQVLASLNHPNIAQIYGVEDSTGAPALVMELVEGPTLADRIAKGLLPLDEALPIAKQIADALEAAHEQGIIHRDLKPANIKVRPDGTVKVLDFGLAKTVDESASAPELTAESPTRTNHPTRRGVILGTAAYMSPEQARGRPLDRRTDVWSFGCVLFEMLAGRAPFAAATDIDVLTAILGGAPDWRRLPDTTPDSITTLLRHCLEKEPRQRLRDIADAQFALTSLDHELADVATRRRYWTGGSLMISAFALVAILVAARVGWMSKARRSDAMPESPVKLTDFSDGAGSPSLSHDGRLLTFLRGDGFGGTAFPHGQVYVKVLPSGEPVQLTADKAGKDHPVFTPDDAQIVYTALMPGLRYDSWQVPVLGGAPQPLLPNAAGLGWMDGQRVMYSSMKSGIHMGVASSTTSRTEYQELYFPASETGMVHRTAYSPKQRSFLAVEMVDGNWLPCRLVPVEGRSSGHPVGPLDGGCTSAAWSPDGQWIFVSSNSGGESHIWRQRLPDGRPEQITFGPLQQEGITVMPDGRHLITSMVLARTGIWLHDSDGKRQLTAEGTALQPTLAPSGTRVFYLLRTGFSKAQASGELWSIELRTQQRSRVLPGLVMTGYSISHDGRRVVFTSAGYAGGDGIWIADVDRRNPPQQLTHGGETRAFFGAPGEIVFQSAGDGSRAYRMREDGSGREPAAPDAIIFLVTVSRDGRWATAVVPRHADGEQTSLKFISLRGERSFVVCDEHCSFGPRSFRGSWPFNWSTDGTHVLVDLTHFGSRGAVLLPYRSDLPLDRLWPRGLETPAAIAANPGAETIDDGDVWPAGRESYIALRSSVQSNLYEVRIPE